MANKEEYHLVVVKSTVVSGTTEDVVIPILEKYSGKKAGSEIGACMNPEFLTEISGTWSKDEDTKKDFFTEDRIVIGEYDKKSGDVLEELYKPLNKPIFRVDLRTAELIKYASNCMLAAKISYWNEIFLICKELGIDSQEVANIVGLDPRIGKYGAKSFVGDEAFALLLGDTITVPGCTKELIKKYEEFKTSIIAVEEVPKEKISSYGIIKGKEVEGDIHLVDDLVEKPSPEEAPSNLGILGRYILTPAIFDAIEQTHPGKGNEIQLTDALRLVREKRYAYVYRGKRYDIGNKLDWIKSNIELSLLDERFNNELEKFLRVMIKDEFPS
ncbi:MAG: sugar phosphate nucleotidyltransferase [Methanophagales archaeon]|nr:sugar phosphate nucleotidyltransferase [Methanophagales archaeon]